MAEKRKSEYRENTEVVAAESAWLQQRLKKGTMERETVSKAW